MTIPTPRPSNDSSNGLSNGISNGISNSPLKTAARLERLVQAGYERGLVDVAYHRFDSPLGPLTAFATEQGLSRLWYDRLSEGEMLEEAVRCLSPRVLRSPKRFDEIQQQLEEYFVGQRQQFDLLIDLRLSTTFSAAVLSAAAMIPFGQVRTYTEVADSAGNARAVRATGSALGRNPLPIIIPCHRVVHQGGRISRYTGGPERKQWLLDLENGYRRVGAAHMD
jgi:O-6-methylguanine DNA methyltransferase